MLESHVFKISLGTKWRTMHIKRYFNIENDHKTIPVHGREQHGNSSIWFIFNDDGASDMRQELLMEFFAVSVFLLEFLCESPLHYIKNRIEYIANARKKFYTPK